MPGPSKCNKIKDAKERQDCMNYKGKYAKMKPAKKAMGGMKKMGGMKGKMGY
tara:strand:+ start:7601 stop:7756 length:156 start_codon:yes stop_codon:yes gene_type:complete